MSRSVVFAFLALVGASTLIGCASDGAAVPDEETYRGQLAAALAPPAGAGWRTDELQRRLLAGIAAEDTFATVIPLSSPRQSNEAEVIILPTVLAAQPGRQGLSQLRLAVRATRKGTGAVGLRNTYEGRSRGREDAVDDVLDALNKDLRRVYREPPVY